MSSLHTLFSKPCEQQSRVISPYLNHNNEEVTRALEITKTNYEVNAHHITESTQPRLISSTLLLFMHSPQPSTPLLMPSDVGHKHAGSASFSSSFINLAVCITSHKANSRTQSSARESWRCRTRWQYLASLAGLWLLHLPV